MSSPLVHSILESMPAHVATVDRDGVIVQVNAAWNDFARDNGGDPKRTGIGANYLEVCRRAQGPYSEGAQECLEGLQALIRGEREQFDLEYPCPGPGEPRWFLLRAVRMRGAEGMAVLSHINISAQKQAEADLRETNRRKDEFLAMLAHELRNPLAPIRNAVNVLRFKSAVADLERHCRIIDRQIAHMSRLLDELLDAARITSGKITLHKRPLLLSEVLIQALEVVTPLMEQRRQMLHVEPSEEPLRVEGDPDRLAQIFINLLSNASKYTGEEGSIWLTMQREGEEAVVSVRDTGVGIDAEMLPHVFDLFAQADKTLDRTQGGLGIGLTMVKELVAMHAGSIQAHSAGPGQGSEFVVRLPLRLEEEQRDGERIAA